MSETFETSIHILVDWLQISGRLSDLGKEKSTYQYDGRISLEGNTISTPSIKAKWQSMNAEAADSSLYENSTSDLC